MRVGQDVLEDPEVLAAVESAISVDCTGWLVCINCLSPFRDPPFRGFIAPREVRDHRRKHGLTHHFRYWYTFHLRIHSKGALTLVNAPSPGPALAACEPCGQVWVMSPARPACLYCGRPPSHVGDLRDAAEPAAPFASWSAAAATPPPSAPGNGDAAAVESRLDALKAPEEPVRVGITCPHCHGGIALEVTESYINVAAQPDPEAPGEESAESPPADSAPSPGDAGALLPAAGEGDAPSSSSPGLDPDAAPAEAG